MLQKNLALKFTRSSLVALGLASLVALNGCSSISSVPAPAPEPPEVIIPAEDELSALSQETPLQEMRPEECVCPPAGAESDKTAKKAEAIEAEQTIASQEQEAVAASAHLIIGQAEWVTIEPKSNGKGIRQKARIDTGATTTSVGVVSFQQYERDSEKWVKFTIKNRISGKESVFKRRLTRMVNIKRHGAEDTVRPVVELELQLGEISVGVEVSLANRDRFDYPVLIGRNFLDGRAMVDVSQIFTTITSGAE